MSTAAQSLPVQEIIGNPNVLAYQANSVTESDMPRTAVEEYWDLYLVGTMTNASYSGAPTAFVESPETLIYSVLVNANAAVKGGVNEAFKNVDFPYLRFITHMYNGTDVTRTGIGTANQAYNFSSTPRLWFTDPLSKLPNGKSTAKSTMLDARLLSSLKLDIGWRNPASLVYGGTGGTTTLSATQLQVLATHYYGVANVAPNGATITRNYLREVQQLYPVVSTQIDYQFQNLRVGAILHRLTIKGLLQPSAAPSSVNFADPSDLILGSNTTRQQGPEVTIQVNNNAYTPLNSVYAQLQFSDTKLFNLTGASPQWPSGYLVYESSTTHNPRAMLNLRSAINMSLFGDTEFTSGQQNNVQLTYVERVTPQ
jgi:hypothetical protein